MPTWKNLDEIDARLEHILQKKSLPHILHRRRVEGVHVYVYFISREELSTCCV
jgi:hypothetical protein